MEYNNEIKEWYHKLRREDGPAIEYNKITIPSPGRRQAIPVVPGVEHHIDNHVGHKHDECCVCLDPIVSPGKKTACGHAICMDCTKQLRKAECPVCRAKLADGYLTQDINQAIQAAERQDIRVIELSDAVYTDYLAANPYREDQAFLNEARDYQDAFALFLANNPEITRNEAIRIFRAFVEFMRLERQKNPNLTPTNGINAFSIIGIQLLNAPMMQFEDVYNMFYHTTH